YRRSLGEIPVLRYGMDAPRKSKQGAGPFRAAAGSVGGGAGPGPQPALAWFLTNRLSDPGRSGRRQRAELAFRKYYAGVAGAVGRMPVRAVRRRLLPLQGPAAGLRDWHAGADPGVLETQTAPNHENGQALLPVARARGRHARHGGGICSGR